QTCQFSNHSTEALAALFSRTFEGMSTVLRNPDHCHIQRALASIEFELSNSLRFEETGELSIRSLMFGLIESLHLTLTHLTEDKTDDHEKVVSKIEEWKKKCLEFSNQSIDALVSVILKGIDSMFNIVKNSDICHIRRSLRTLDFERSQSFHDDITDEFSIRSLMYGMMESIHLTLLHLTEKRNQSNRSEEVPTGQNHFPSSLSENDNSEIHSTHSIDLMSTIPTFTTNFQSRVKHEPVESSESIHGENE
ncbi:hypothetical protein PMAYCL1PPCAC_05099, partial [Pristionchus mayeri]